MTDKSSFLIFKSWGTLIDDLDNETAGILIKAIFDFQRGEDVTIDNPVLAAVFKVMIKEFEENDAKYQEICDKRREAINKRWNKSKEENTDVSVPIQKNTNEYKSIQMDTEPEPDLEPEPDIEPVFESDIENHKGSKKRKQSKREVEIVPNYAKDPVLNATILEFLAYRKQMRSSMSDIAVTKMLAKLEKIGKSDHERIEILNQSMENGWKGIFPLDKVKPKNTDVDWEAL